jgi:hypothetical protein
MAISPKPDVERDKDYDHFTVALLTFGIAAEVLAAAAIQLFRGRASVLAV